MIDGLHVQTGLGDQAVTNDRDDDAAHRERGTVRVPTPPVELAPLGFPGPQEASSSARKSGTPSNTEVQFASTCARPRNARPG